MAGFRLCSGWVVLLLVISFSCGANAKASPHEIEACGGWRSCLEKHKGTDVPLVWFETWNSTIQTQAEELLARSRAQEEGGSKDDGLLVIFSGDSTIIQQFQVLGEFLKLRSDFHPVVGDNAEKQQIYELTIGGPRSTPGSVTFVFYRVFEACVLASKNPLVVNAYAMYFGCGMHLLHLLPVQGPALITKALESWDGYEELLRRRVQEWRQVNEKIKLVFMATHTIDEEKYVGDWHDALEGYRARDPAFIEPCKAQFEANLPRGSPRRENIEQACVDSVFGARGVQLLNDRGLAVMQEAGVPVVPAHQIVDGQHWATAEYDGRHFPYLVPLELFLFFLAL